MNTVLKYVSGFDLLNCQAKFRGNTINSAGAYGWPDVTLGSGTLCIVTILVIFVSVKPEARRGYG